MATDTISNTIENVIEKALQWGLSQVGKATGNSIWGIAYPQWVGTGYHWCGGFVVAAYKQFGVDLMKCTWFFYTPYIRTFAIRIGAWKTSGPNRGDLPLYDWQLDGVIDHVGMAVPDPSSAQYRAVEGNTSPGTAGSQSAGGGCWVRYRNRRDIAGWVDIRVLLAYMIRNGLWNGQASGTVGLPSISKPPVVVDSSVEEETVKGAFYKKDSNTVVYMLFNEVSGFVSEFGAGTNNGKMSGAYVNPLATNWGTGSWPEITKSHADAIKRDLAKVREGVGA